MLPTWKNRPKERVTYRHSTGEKRAETENMANAILSFSWAVVKKLAVMWTKELLHISKHIHHAHIDTHICRYYLFFAEFARKYT